MADELYDEWANEGGGGAPVVSWKYSDVGDSTNDTFVGIIVPPKPLIEPEKGYEIIGDRNKEGRRVWPPKVGYTPKPGVKPDAPISENQYLQIVGNTTDMRVVSLTCLTLMTEYRNKQFFSGPQKTRALENEEFKDDGVRRFIVDGADVPPKFKAAVKAIRAKGPQNGQRFTIQIIAREPNSGGKEGETNRFKITLEPPTAETMKVVQAWIDAAKSDEAATGTDDPWAGTPVATGTEPPPF